MIRWDKNHRQIKEAYIKIFESSEEVVICKNLLSEIWKSANEAWFVWLGDKKVKL